MLKGGEGEGYQHTAGPIYKQDFCCSPHLSGSVLRTLILIQLYQKQSKTLEFERPLSARSGHSVLELNASFRPDCRILAIPFSGSILTHIKRCIMDTSYA